MITTDTLIELLMDLEGVSLDRYKDIAGYDTIGAGHLIIKPKDKALEEITGKPTAEIDVISPEQVHELLAHDLSKFEVGVTKALKVKVTNHEFDALVSLAFNIGLGAFRKSTLLRYLNQGNRTAAADQFLRWNKAGGRFVDGLYKRRVIERGVFLLKPDIPKSMRPDHVNLCIDMITDYMISLNKE